MDEELLVDGEDGGSTAQAALDLAVAGTRPDVLSAMASSGEWCTADLDPLLRQGVLEVDAEQRLHFASEDCRNNVLSAAPASAVCAAHRRAAVVGAALHLPLHERVRHVEAASLLADATIALELEELGRLAEAEDQVRLAAEAWQAAARLSPDASSRVSRATHGLQLVVMNGLDYADVDEFLALLAGEQLSGECACWVEWIKALRRSEVNPGSAVTAQWTTIRQAKEASSTTLRALLWDAAMNAWTLGDPPGGLRAAQAFARLTQAAADEDAAEPYWTGTALLSAAHFELGEVEEAEALRAQAIEVARATSCEDLTFDRLVSVVFLDDLLIDMSDEAGHRLAVALERAPHESATQACLLGIAAWRARAQGDWALADELLARGRSLAAATGATGAQAGMGALTVELAAIRGVEQVVAREWEPLRDRAHRAGDRRRLSTLDRAVGLSALASGRVEEAVVRLRAVADLPFLGRRLRDGVLMARVDVVEALTRLGHHDEARSRASATTPTLEAMDEPLARALAERLAALASEGDTAADHYRSALDWHGPGSDPFERGRTLLLAGEHARRERRRTDARLHLIEATEIFERMVARPWLERAHTELRAVGGHAERQSGDVHLTAQEWEVAGRAAQGLSTREIAEALFLSPRTVEFHLSSVYRKLGIRGRAALSAHLDTVK